MDLPTQLAKCVALRFWSPNRPTLLKSKIWLRDNGVTEWKMDGPTVDSAALHLFPKEATEAISSAPNMIIQY